MSTSSHPMPEIVLVAKPVGAMRHIFGEMGIKPGGSVAAVDDERDSGSSILK